MQPEIYYFSGTGNSLAVARIIATKTGGEIIAIPSVMNSETICPSSDSVGLVFPVYHGGLPLLIQQFVEKLVSLDNKYIFGVCTYGDSPGLALEYLEKRIQSRGGVMAAGFGVHMPYNYITPSFSVQDFLGSFTLREIPPEKQQILFAEAWKKLETICGDVNNRRAGTIEKDAVLISRLVDAVNLHDSIGKSVWLRIAGVTEQTGLPFRESIQRMDSAFFSDANCKGCGTCARVCPVGNINLLNKRPVWQQHCEQCFACLQWCPSKAIQFGNNTAGKQRYHHPDVKVEEMFNS
jgi:ferredoxin